MNQARPSPAATPQAVSGDIATTRPNWLDCRSGRLPRGFYESRCAG